MTNEKLERILVIDDDSLRITNSLTLFGARARNILVVAESYNLNSAKNFADDLVLRYNSTHNDQVSVETGGEALIAKALSEESYKAILLDGNLGMGLERQYFDGNVVARKLKKGVYGIANQNTRLFSTSSCLKAVPQANEMFYLTSRNKVNQEDIDYAKELLEELFE